MRVRLPAEHPYIAACQLSGGIRFRSARRWALDPQRTLARRSVDELPLVRLSSVGGQGILLDTGVYTERMQDGSPQMLDDGVAQRQVNHSTVAIQELMNTVGVC